MNRRAAILLLVLAAAAALPGAALATAPDDEGNHTIDICHVTNSETNEFVLLTVDYAAFDGEGRDDHSHHTNKFGNSDHLPADLNGDGVASCGETPPPPPTTTTYGG